MTVRAYSEYTSTRDREGRGEGRAYADTQVLVSYRGGGGTLHTLIHKIQYRKGRGRYVHTLIHKFTVSKLQGGGTCIL